MSGSVIPYRLRQNKAVDRYAFIELLSKLDRYPDIDIENSMYVGFGGYSLEDFKHIHGRFGTTRMISLESNINVYKRQQFNLPHSCIECRNQCSGEFIDTFYNDSESGLIVWLDYISRDIGKQMEELQDLLAKASPFDIIKITLNAHASTYSSYQKDESVEELRERRMKTLADMLADNFPTGRVEAKMMTEKSFPTALCYVVMYSSKKAMESSYGFSFQPLTVFSYADGQQMLTVTGVILEDNLKEKFLKITGIDSWELKNLNWSAPRKIDIPNFTTKEKIFVDSLLPSSSAEEIHEKLDLTFSDKPNESLRLLKNYILFYRQSPYFSTISI